MLMEREMMMIMMQLNPLPITILQEGITKIKNGRKIGLYNSMNNDVILHLWRGNLAYQYHMGNTSPFTTEAEKYLGISFTRLPVMAKSIPMGNL